MEIELDRCDYGDTSVKLSITAKKNLKGPKNPAVVEIKEHSEKKYESKDGTWVFISNDSLDEIDEKYVENDDEDDEFFRGYSKAIDFSQPREATKTDERTLDMRQKLIMEDFTPSTHKKKTMVKPSPRYAQADAQIMRTPTKEDIGSKQDHYRKNSRGGNISGNKNNVDNIKMLDFEDVEESRIEQKEDTNADRDSTIKQLLALYGEKMSAKLSQLEVKTLIEAGIKQAEFGSGYKQAKTIDQSLFSKANNEHQNNSFRSDEKFSKEVGKRVSKELEATKEKLTDSQVRNERLIFELKAKDSELAIEIK